MQQTKCKLVIVLIVDYCTPQIFSVFCSLASHSNFLTNILFAIVFLQGSGVVDTALLYEAHGLVTEMLLDQASLPPNIVAGLKALATLLKPTPTPMHCSSRPRPAPLSITTDPEYTSDVDEIPYTGEKLSTMPKVSEK